MDAQEFVRYLNDRNYFSSRDPQRPPRFDPSEYGRGTDWIDEITRTALYQNYNLSVSGRSQKSSYFAALGGNDTQGIVDGSGFRRITAPYEFFRTTHEVARPFGFERQLLPPRDERTTGPTTSAAATTSYGTGGPYRPSVPGPVPTVP